MSQIQELAGDWVFEPNENTNTPLTTFSVKWKLYKNLVTMATRLIGSLFIQSSTKCVHALRVFSYGKSIKDNNYHSSETVCR